MSKDLSPPAFPLDRKPSNDWWSGTNPVQTGMSLRDYFAAKAMEGIAVKYGTKGPSSGGYSRELIADFAYRLADAMLAEREK